MRANGTAAAAENNDDDDDDDNIIDICITFMNIIYDGTVAARRINDYA